MLLQYGFTVFALQSLLSWNSWWWSQSLARGPARLMCLTTSIDLPIPVSVPKSLYHLLSWVFSIGVPELYSSENSAYLQVVHYLTEKYFFFIINSTTLKGSWHLWHSLWHLPQRVLLHFPLCQKLYNFYT